MKKLEEVFKTSGIPTYTFVEPTEYNKLLVSVRTPGRGVVIEGPSGIGKTTSVLNILEKLELKNALVLSGRKPADIPIIQELSTMENIGTVIIDDFHKLDDAIKESIANYLKRLADEENTNSKVIVVGINKAGNSLIHFAADLTGRIDVIQFEANPVEKVIELISKGESALNIEFSIRDALAKEAQGSFHMAQMLCLQACLSHDILEEQQSLKQLKINLDVLKENVLENLYATFFEKAKTFATGPKLHQEGRAPYLFLLYSLGKQNEWSLDIDDLMRHATEHKASIQQIVEKGYLAKHLAKNLQIADIIHYDAETKMLSIEDPKFVYFLRNILWTKFAKKVGYKTLTFEKAYDFALSFAGNDRIIVEKISNKLAEKEIAVFYDRNEQSSLLAVDIEAYLAPIYRSEATYVVVFLGPEYPKRIWTKFESEQFKHRFGEGAVIPIWFNNTQPGVFDETRRVGGIEFDTANNPDCEANRIAALLAQKISENRRRNNIQ